MARLKRVAILVTLLVLVACGQIYWAFPPGKMLADFERDQQACFWTMGTMQQCMAAKDYRQISRDQYRAMQAQALGAQSLTSDIVGYDVATGELYIGRAETAPGALTASIEIEGLDLDVSCVGSSEVTILNPLIKGSIASAVLVCRDGRTVTATFTYETALSGWGVGVDSDGHEYRFIFGDLDLNPDALREQFRKRIEQEKIVEQGA